MGDRTDLADLGVLLLDAYAVLETRVAAALVDAGYGDIRPAHSSAFQQLNATGATVTSMAAGAGVTKQHMSQLVRELSTLGYLRRAADPADRRRTLITLTERGAEAAEVADRALLRVHHDWATLLGPSEAKNLVELLRRLAATAPIAP
jgi:DNA-binding MarR family transcriptional regulator